MQIIVDLSRASPRVLSLEWACEGCWGEEVHEPYWGKTGVPRGRKCALHAVYKMPKGRCRVRLARLMLVPVEQTRSAAPPPTGLQ